MVDKWLTTVNLIIAFVTSLIQLYTALHGRKANKRKKPLSGARNTKKGKRKK
jgi:hypothetical protein